MAASGRAPTIESDIAACRPCPEDPCPRNHGIKELCAELGRVNDLLTDARAREVAATMAKFREDVALLGITEQVQRALGYDRPARLPEKHYDPFYVIVGRNRCVTTRPQ